MAHKGHTFRHLGRRPVVVDALQYYDGTGTYVGSGFPSSGTSGTTVKAGGGAPPLAKYIDYDSGVEFFNEGTIASPYWTPVDFTQPNLIGCYEDFRGPDPKGIADTAAALHASSGMRSFGGGGATTKGVANTDSGVLGGTDVAGSHVGILRTTDEDETVAAVGLGSATAVLTPATNGPLVVDILWSQLTDILTRRIFVGFLGEAADAMIPSATGATTVVTFDATGTAGDNQVGFFMDANLTDADALSFINVLANGGATQTTVVAALDTPTNLAAAGTYQRMRVEVDAAGNALGFINKVQVASTLLASTPATALIACAGLYVESGTTILNATAKQFMAWGKRS